MFERLRNGETSKIATDVYTDFASLLSQEMKLAKLEVGHFLSQLTLPAGLFVASAIVALIALLLVFQTAILGLIHLGLAPYLACLCVLALAFVLAAVLFVLGRSMARKATVPRETYENIRRDWAAMKEQFK